MQQDQADPRTLRRAPRHKIFQRAEMIGADGACMKVHLLNVSAGGALVHAAEAPSPGAEIRFLSGVPGGRGRVAWRSGQRFGVAFSFPLSQRQLDAFLQRQEERFLTAAGKLGITPPARCTP